MRIESYRSFLLAASCIVLSACSSTPSSSSSISDAELERVQAAISSLSLATSRSSQNLAEALTSSQKLASSRKASQSFVSSHKLAEAREPS